MTSMVKTFFCEYLVNYLTIKHEKKPNLRTIKKLNEFIYKIQFCVSKAFQSVTVAAIPSNSWQSISLLIMVVVFVTQLHGDC